MYSRIPMPRVEWKEENRRYSLCFFPLIGAVIGGLLLLWQWACPKFRVGDIMNAAVCVMIPILVTGGIHIDGFCDTTDALASYADRQKKLAIMSDPHIGSFAVMKLCLYLIVQTALLSQVDSLRTAAVIACGYVLSRALSGLSAITFKAAKKEGTLQSFVRPAHRRITAAIEAVFIVGSAAGMVAILPVQGVSAVLVAAVVLAYHRYASYRDFGGITGDLCGWFLQICEIFMLAAVVFSGRIIALWS